MEAPETLNLSWSKMRIHDECHQKAWLMNKAKSPAQDIRNYFAGSVVDLIMRTWLDQDSPESGAMPLMVEDTIEKYLVKAKDTGDGVVRWKHKSDRQEITEFCVELLVKLEPILQELVLPFDYEPAKRFKTPITIPYLDGTPTEINLIGEYDLLVRDDTGYKIWDLKATRDDSYWKKTIGQLVFYDLSVISMFGVKTTGVGLIQPMCTKPIMAFDISMEDRKTMLSRICRLAESLWRGDRDLKDGTAGCDYCPVKHACERYAPKTANGKTTVSLLGRK